MNKELRLEPLTFEEALQHFKDKLPMTLEEFKALEAVMRARAFTVANVATLDIVQAIYDELLKAIETGGTIAEFRERVNAYIEDEGYIGLSAYRTDNIFRTNIQTAYNAGRYEQQTLPAVAEGRPIWIYDAVNDDRTRPAHRAMNGVARRFDDHFWDTWYPPNGYRCRCSVRSASEEGAARRGLTVDTAEMSVNLSPDPGFETNPAKSGWRPDMTKYQADLKKQYEEKEAQGP
jgi:SPP1 gp7 family putative phage head morphogenesis protein